MILNNFSGDRFEDYMKKMCDILLPFASDMHLMLIESIAYSLPRSRRRAAQMLLCYYPVSRGFVSLNGVSLPSIWTNEPESKDLFAVT